MAPQSRYRKAKKKQKKTIGTMTTPLTMTIGTPKPMPLLPITSPTTLKLCQTLPSQSSDIFICSYPKSGTTWTQHIVLSLLLAASATKKNHNHHNNESSIIESYQHVSDYAPFYEVDAHWDFDEQNLIHDIQTRHAKLGRRVFNTHLRWDMLPQPLPHDSTRSTKDNDVKQNTGTLTCSSAAKYIYIMRSPLDVCVSFYHHLSNQIEGRYEDTFDQFYEDWLNGDIAFGSWVDHVLSFAPALARNSENVLLLTYENLLNDLAGEVDRIAEFLGIDCNVSEAKRRSLLPTFAFDYMKSGDNLIKFQPKSVTWRDGFQFLRKGVSGDSALLVSDDQRASFCRVLKEARFEDCVSACFDGSVDDPLVCSTSTCSKDVILKFGMIT